jgi:hypothetical protein
MEGPFIGTVNGLAGARPAGACHRGAAAAQRADARAHRALAGRPNPPGRPDTILSLVVVALVPITTSAGEWLERRTAGTPLLHDHTESGDTAIWVAIPVAVVAAPSPVKAAILRRCRPR